ncbi:MAG: hypothetical protein AABW54_04825 [Candidatus Micrarchaeota archaeon]
MIDVFSQPSRKNKWAFAVVLLAVVIVLADVALVAWIGAPAPLMAIMAFVLATVLVVAYGFATMRFSFGNGVFTAKFFPFSYDVRAKDFVKVELLSSTPWWVGWGVRAWGRTLYFIGDHGPAVAISKKSGFFRKVVFTPVDAKEFHKQLRK